MPISDERVRVIGEQYNEWNGMSRMSAEIAAICTELLALREEARWRRCEEEYPEERGVVLGWHPAWSEPQQVTFCPDADGRLWYDDADLHVLATWPTHWRPLPRGPEEVR